VRRLIADPLIPFLLLGGIIFTAYHFFAPSSPPPDIIEAPPEAITALVQQREELLGRPVAHDEKQTIIDTYIDDEVLLREARRQGLDQNDGRVRQRLLSVMRYRLTDPIPDPTPPQLKAYFEENIDRFRSDFALTLEHVYFAWNSKELPQDSDAFLAELAESETPFSLGDPVFPSNTIPRATRVSLLGGFGPAFTDAVMALPPDKTTWRGPFESHQGTHYVRILEAHDPQVPAFENIEPYLQQEYLMNKSRDAQQQRIDTLRENYQIIINED
jgi:hypothetical protein